ncbi:Abortive infection bacteriophage resistance protein [Corynebacterium renale]|uniref:Abi family protein n=1 Tax=Corynebacterium renale TaxID=1724 RepID=UPI000DA398D5|nr:Abi family protein [Corynebacterium renale]SQG63591.1 Abortive infection bacteriophage resistance protein [Corynebacterium renale]STD01083.1 Abortive infection bacteriophage resistance protein [Corynebacterium renale]
MRGRAKVHFSKPAISLDQQVQKIRGRGLRAQKDELTAAIERIGYYRLSGYMWWFYEDSDSHLILPGTTLDQVISLYEFDSTLRTLIMRLSEPIEVWLRSALANALAHHYGPMGYQDKTKFHNQEAHLRDLGELDKRLRDRHQEFFIKAFYKKYADTRPPIWMVTELMSIGLLSKFYNNIKQEKIRKDIAKRLDIHQSVLASFLQVFTIFRNAAAHHSRVWNRQTSLTMSAIRNPPHLLSEAIEDADRSSLYYLLAVAAFIVHHIDPHNNVVSDLRNHLLSAEDDWLDDMDVPIDFHSSKLWNP